MMNQCDYGTIGGMVFDHGTIGGMGFNHGTIGSMVFDHGTIGSMVFDHGAIGGTCIFTSGLAQCDLSKVFGYGTPFHRCHTERTNHTHHSSCHNPGVLVLNVW